MSSLSPIIRRAQWAVRSVSLTALPVRPARFVFVHHAVSGVEGSTVDLDNDGLPDSFEAILRSIEAFHIDTRGWRAIAYNLLVGHKAGRKAEGRGWGVEGGATGSWADDQGISICAVGNYDGVHEATDELMLNIAEVIAEGILLGELVPLDSLTIVGHRDKPYATACPGRDLYARLHELRPMVEGILAEQAQDDEHFQRLTERIKGVRERIRRTRARIAGLREVPEPERDTERLRAARERMRRLRLRLRSLLDKRQELM